LSTENSAGLADNLVNAIQIAGQDGGLEIKAALDNALDAANDKADEFANVLNGMNWNSADEWEKLPEILNNLGIDTTNAAFENLINKVKEFNVSVKMIDIDSLAEKI
jgi:enolase